MHTLSFSLFSSTSPVTCLLEAIFKLCFAVSLYLLSECASFFSLISKAVLIVSSHAAQTWRVAFTWSAFYTPGHQDYDGANLSKMYIGI